MGDAMETALTRTLPRPDAIRPQNAPNQRTRANGARRRLLLGVAAALLAFGLGAEIAAACQPASYCRTAGNCISTGQVQAQVAARYGGQGYRVARVRLVGHAPTPTCLWYEVVLRHGSQPARVIYWDIRGGQAG